MPNIVNDVTLNTTPTLYAMPNKECSLHTMSLMMLNTALVEISNATAVTTIVATLPKFILFILFLFICVFKDTLDFFVAVDYKVIESAIA
jgi:hypothetical protein